MEQIKTLSENADLIEERPTVAILAEANLKVPFSWSGGGGPSGEMP
ncbi:hypothetical protein [Streptomyces marianii]|nr:hypothetical protein [Streptomyces marianii]